MTAAGQKLSGSPIVTHTVPVDIENEDGDLVLRITRNEGSGQTILECGDNQIVMNDGFNDFEVVQQGTIRLQIAGSATDDDTEMVLRVDKGGTHSTERVKLGAADSGGTGLRALCVDN